MRKINGKKETNILLTLRVSLDLYERMLQAAQSANLSQSEYIRRAVEAYKPDMTSFAIALEDHIRRAFEAYKPGDQA